AISTWASISKSDRAPDGTVLSLWPMGWAAPLPAKLMETDVTILISGEGLDIAAIGAVGRGAKVALSSDPQVLGRIEASRAAIAAAIDRGEQIYGVSTLFGGMADQYVGPELMAEVQKLALWQHKSTTGPR